MAGPTAVTNNPGITGQPQLTIFHLPKYAISDGTIQHMIESGQLTKPDALMQLAYIKDELIRNDKDALAKFLQTDIDSFNSGNFGTIDSLIKVLNPKIFEKAYAKYRADVMPFAKWQSSKAVMAQAKSVLAKNLPESADERRADYLVRMHDEPNRLESLLDWEKYEITDKKVRFYIAKYVLKYGSAGFLMYINASDLEQDDLYALYKMALEMNHLGVMFYGTISYLTEDQRTALLVETIEREYNLISDPVRKFSIQKDENKKRLAEAVFKKEGFVSNIDNYRIKDEKFVRRLVGKMFMKSESSSHHAVLRNMGFSRALYSIVEKLLRQYGYSEGPALSYLKRFRKGYFLKLIGTLLQYEPRKINPMIKTSASMPEAFARFLVYNAVVGKSHNKEVAKAFIENNFLTDYLDSFLAINKAVLNYRTVRYDGFFDLIQVSAEVFQDSDATAQFLQFMGIIGSDFNYRVWKAVSNEANQKSHSRLRPFKVTKENLPRLLDMMNDTERMRSYRRGIPR